MKTNCHRWPLLAFALLSGCVVTPYNYESAPTYQQPSYGVNPYEQPMPELPYVRETVLSGTPYYVSSGINYYFASGRYFYVDRGRRYYVSELPNRGYYNNHHPYYSQRTIIPRTVVYQNSPSPAARPLGPIERYSASPPPTRPTSGFPTRNFPSAPPWTPPQAPPSASSPRGFFPIPGNQNSATRNFPSAPQVAPQMPPVASSPQGFPNRGIPQRTEGPGAPPAQNGVPAQARPQPQASPAPQRSASPSTKQKLMPGEQPAN
jgi:hypothetical protein